jgi:hypothetical protein
VTILHSYNKQHLKTRRWLGFLVSDRILFIDSAVPFKLTLVVYAYPLGGARLCSMSCVKLPTIATESINRPISALSSIERGARFSEPTNNCLQSMRKALVCRVSASGPLHIGPIAGKDRRPYQRSICSKMDRYRLL